MVSGLPQESHAHPGPVTDYWERSRRPIHGLYFLLPLLFLYELGAWVYAGEGQGRLPMIFAERLLIDALRGVWGDWLVYTPPVVVVLVLVCWHVVRRDPWDPEPKLYGVMLLESLLWAVPLFLYMAVVFRSSGGGGGGGAGELLAATGGASKLPSWQAGVVLSVGAGIYEELLFRLIAIAVFYLLLINVLAVPMRWGTIGVVALSSLAFGLYHFDWSASWGEFFYGIDWGLMVFYTASGVYFAVIYLLRGFGVVAATHAAYDVLAVLLQFGIVGVGAR